MQIISAAIDIAQINRLTAARAKPPQRRQRQLPPPGRVVCLLEQPAFTLALANTHAHAHALLYTSPHRPSFYTLPAVRPPALPLACPNGCSPPRPPSPPPPSSAAAATASAGAEASSTASSPPCRWHRQHAHATARYASSASPNAGCTPFTMSRKSAYQYPPCASFPHSLSPTLPRTYPMP